MATVDVKDTVRKPKNSISWLGGATGPLVGLILLCLFLAFASDKFLSVRNGLNILDQITVIGIMAVGMTYVILIGGIDLSVGSVLALSMMIMGWLANVAGYPMAVAIPLALVASGVCGLIVGLMVTRFKVPAFIATLAMMSAARGVANMITDGQQIVGFPEWFMMLAIDRHFGVLTATVFLMLIVLLVSWLFLQFRSEGRMLYAIGGNPEVARLAASMCSSPPFSSTCSAPCSPVWPASCSPPVSTRSSPPAASATNSTRSRRSSSAAPRCRVAPAASAER